MKYDKLWHQQYEKLLEFKRKTGHCMVPGKYKEDMSLGIWVNKQRCNNTNNKIRLDRKRLLDEIGFAWKADANFKPDDKSWHQQYEKLLEFKRKTGHYMVPQKYEQDKSLGQWVHTQRKCYTKNKMRQDRKELLDQLNFFGKLEFS
jgi:nitrate reductase assembly molybdenum cofactor insertion protein NarJ